MHTFEIRTFDFMCINQLSLTPETDLIELMVDGVNAQIHLLIGVCVDFELYMVDRDPSVRIYGSVHSEAEDIFYGLERGDDLEFSKE